MSLRDVQLEGQMGAVAGFPPPADLADVWLVHAFAHLLNAYEVSESDRRALVHAGIDAWRPEISKGPAASNEAARLQRLDASRLALVSAALAVEARMNRVLRSCEPSEWEAVAHLVPARRFRLAPRLLDEHESASKHAALCDLVDEIFHVRDELVDAAGQLGTALNVSSSRFSPVHARALVEASAKISCFLATLSDEHDSGTAELVRDAAHALGRWVDVPLEVRPSRARQWDWNPDDLDFPPDIVGS